VDEREGIGKDVRKIQGFRGWGRDKPDAGRFIPARDAGIAPQEKRGGQAKSDRTSPPGATRSDSAGRKPSEIPSQPRSVSVFPPG